MPALGVQGWRIMREGRASSVGMVGATPIVMHHTDHEAQSVARLTEYLMDNERSTVTLGEIGALAPNLRSPEGRPVNVAGARAALLAYAAECGMALTVAATVRAPQGRGFTACDNNRWHNSESAGGSGHEQINGFAGQQG